MPTFASPADLLKTEFHARPLAEVLQQPPTVLLGVSDAAAAALAGIDVRTVFDLALSRVFQAAEQLTDAAGNPSNPFQRFGAPTSDMVADGVPGGTRVSEMRFLPLGQVVEMAGTPRTVVGVVRDTRDVRLDVPADPQWYLPLLFEGSQLVVRTAGDPARLVEPLRRALLAADPGLIVHRVEPLGAIVAASVFERRLAGRLLSAFAGVALALAGVGLSGVLSVGTARRRRELGVRAALGARPRGLLRMVVGQGVGLAAAGVGLGVVASVPLTRLLRGLLFEVRPADPVAVSAAAALLLAVAAAASLAPAWRAARADPMAALREE